MANHSSLYSSQAINGSRANKAFFHDIPKKSRLTREGEVMLTSLAQKGNLEARNEIIESNLPYIIFIANKYSWLNITSLELIQEGVIGLIKGIEKFDPKLGYRFSTYVYWWISQEITRSTKSTIKEIRLPSHITDIRGKIYQAKYIMKGMFGYDPTSAEIADFLELPIEKVDHALTLAYVSKSMQENISHGDESLTLAEVIIIDDDKQNPATDTIFLNKQLVRILHTLSPLGEYILRMRYAGE